MRHLAAFAALVSTVALGATALAQPAEVRPIVLTGADLPLLLEAPVTAPVCFALLDGSWAPCPLQVDERARLDRAAPYPSDLWGEYFGVDSVYHYTAPQDYPMPGFTPTVPADPDPTLDADDEVVLMTRFFGEKATADAPPLPHASGRMHELELAGRYAYLFVPTRPLDQSGGHALVRYDFDLLAGSFPDAYDFTSDHFAQYASEGYGALDSLAANPEYSVVETPYYRTTFEDRWIQRELQIADRAGHYGPDVLDRVKLAPSPDHSDGGECGRTTWTGSAARGTLGIQKSGPVRALRVVQGYNSGVYNTATYRIYERSMTMESVLAMHATSTSLWYDLSDEAVGMTLYTSKQPEGLRIDGVPDTPDEGVYSPGYIEWDALVGAPGTMVGTWEEQTNVTNLQPASYKDDADAPALTNCGGDGKALGNFGNFYRSDAETARLGSTDPREPEAYFPDGELRRFSATRQAAFGPPALAPDAVEALLAALQTPPAVTVTTVAVAAEDAPPAAAFAAAAYPTLATEGVMFHLRLPEAAEVAVAVYDLTGRLVATAVEAPLAAGPHAIRLATRALPSGVYVWRATSEATTQTGRFTVLR